ncbi:MAG: ATP-binding protein [Rhabdochlamydiaceae bacterium]|nr:ATP-binding protein [Rhabdochlamydiaceae bacterium]
MKEWSAFLDEHHKTVGSDAIERWARTLKILHFDAGNLYLEATDPFQLNWFEQYLRPLIKKSFQTMNGRPIRVHLTLSGTPSKEPKKEWKPPLDLHPDSLLTNCTIQTYFPGVTNDFHFKLFCDAILKKTYNPIYVQGAPGVGKTHLLIAACHLLKEQNRTVFYVKADRFTQHIVAAIRSGAMTSLRELYRKHDVLVIDEIEALDGRSASQEELFHTFNALHLAGKQIILAGNALPSDLKGIEPRLTSRFEWGLVLSFKILNTQDREAYFSQLLYRKKITLEPAIITECLNLLSTIPLLNRAADILEVRSKAAQPTIPLLHMWLSPLIQEQQKKALTSDAILLAVARHFDIHLEDLTGRSQTQEHTTPRQIAMHLCRSQLHLPYMKIADLFSRDHSTVMTSVKIIDKRIQDTPTIQDTIGTLLKDLNLD